jgi:hypothetical protein
MVIYRLCPDALLLLLRLRLVIESSARQENTSAQSATAAKNNIATRSHGACSELRLCTLESASALPRPLSHDTANLLAVPAPAPWVQHAFGCRAVSPHTSCRLCSPPRTSPVIPLPAGRCGPLGPSSSLSAVSSGSVAGVAVPSGHSSDEDVVTGMLRPDDSRAPCDTHTQRSAPLFLLHSHFLSSYASQAIVPILEGIDLNVEATSGARKSPHKPGLKVVRGGANNGFVGTVEELEKQQCESVARTLCRIARKPDV